MTDTEKTFAELYTVVERLGSGSFGDVFKVISHDTDREYAMKQDDRISEDSKPRRREEVKALRKCDHKNIVKYYANFIEGTVQRIIMEYCPGGDLAKKIKQQRMLRKYIAHEVMVEWILDLASGLDYLRHKKILHRDLKPANIFISHTKTSKTRLKIGDFGLARCMNRYNVQHILQHILYFSFIQLKGQVKWLLLSVELHHILHPRFSWAKIIVMRY